MTDLERRVAALEKEVAQLKHQYRHWLPYNTEFVEELLNYELSARERAFLLQLRQQKLISRKQRQWLEAIAHRVAEDEEMEDAAY